MCPVLVTNIHCVQPGLLHCGVDHQEMIWSFIALGCGAGPVHAAAAVDGMCLAFRSDAARWGLTDQQRQHQLRAGSLVLACTIG